MPGTPEIDNQPAIIVNPVMGRYLKRLPYRRMSCSCAMAWITAPAPRNSSPLKNACVVTWNMPAPNAPAPHAINMNPSWETVEYASTFLMSVCPNAISAANSAVNAPTMATTALATGDSSNSRCMRLIRYTPPVTIVAAWMSAETGVGPAIASGSQK